MNILKNKFPGKEKLLKFVMLLPLYWSFSGLFLYNDGKKELTALVIFVLIVRLIFIGYQDIWNNIKNNKLLWIIGVNLLFAIIAYATYGFSSSKFRVLIVFFVYFSILPYDLLKNICYKRLIWMLSVTTLFFLLLQSGNSIFPSRAEWDINPIRYATVCAFLVVANLYFLFNSEDRNSRIISFLAALFPLFTLVLSQSRGPWLAFMVGFLVLLFSLIKHKKTNYKISLIVLFSVCLTVIAFKKPIEQRIDKTLWEIQKINSDDFNTSIGLRFQMWKSAFFIIDEHWLTGVGNNSMQIKQSLVNKGIVSKEVMHFNHFHNQYINDLAKYGILGLILTLLLFVFPLMKRKKSNYTLVLILVSVYMVAAFTNMPLRNSHPLGFYLINLYLLLPVKSKTS